MSGIRDGAGMTVENPYSELVLRYFDDPPCAGSLDAAQSDVFTGNAGATAVGSDGVAMVSNTTVLSLA